MTYISKHIVEPCKCALWVDAMWFASHPDRRMNLRVPYKCEAAHIADQPHVSQVIVTTISNSINQQAAEAKDKKFILDVEVRRYSFLFVGKIDTMEKNSDDEISQFLKIIDDNQGYQTRN